MVFMRNLTAYLTLANGSAVVMAYFYSTVGKTINNGKPETWNFDRLITYKWIQYFFEAIRDSAFSVSHWSFALRYWSIGRQM